MRRGRRGKRRFVWRRQPAGVREAGSCMETLNWRATVRIGIFVDSNIYNEYEKIFVSLLMNELSKREHEILLYLPENIKCDDLGLKKVVRLMGKSESSNLASGIKKLISYIRFGFSRQGWFSQLFLETEKKSMDAVIFPFADYRCLRAVQKNSLRDAYVPIVFLIHNLSAGSAIKVFREAKKMSRCKNLRVVALTFDGHLFPQKLGNLFLTYPPVQEADMETTYIKEKLLEGVKQKSLLPEAFVLRIEKIINAEYVNKS